MARLGDIEVEEVSYVDKAANKRKFLLTKRDSSSEGGENLELIKHFKGNKSVIGALEGIEKNLDELKKAFDTELAKSGLPKELQEKLLEKKEEFEDIQKDMNQMFEELFTSKAEGYAEEDDEDEEDEEEAEEVKAEKASDDEDEEEADEEEMPPKKKKTRKADDTKAEDEPEKSEENPEESEDAEEISKSEESEDEDEDEDEDDDEEEEELTSEEEAALLELKKSQEALLKDIKETKEQISK